MLDAEKTITIYKSKMGFWIIRGEKKEKKKNTMFDFVNQTKK